MNDLIVLFTLLCMLASSNQADLASGHLIFLTIAFVQEVSIHMCMCMCARVRVCVHACVCMCACMSLSQTSSVPFLIAPNYNYRNNCLPFFQFSSNSKILPSGRLLVK